MTFAREDGGGTRVTNAIEPGADGWFTTVLFTVGRPLVRWMMERRLRDELDALKAIIESSLDGSRTESGSDLDRAPAA